MKRSLWAAIVAPVAGVGIAVLLASGGGGVASTVVAGAATTPSTNVAQSDRWHRTAAEATASRRIASGHGTPSDMAMLVASPDGINNSAALPKPLPPIPGGPTTGPGSLNWPAIQSSSVDVTAPGLYHLTIGPVPADTTSLNGLGVMVPNDLTFEIGGHGGQLVTVNGQKFIDYTYEVTSVESPYAGFSIIVD